MTKKSSLMIPAGLALAAAALFIACAGAIDPGADDGWVSISINTGGSNGRAITKDIARDNIDFYEVVFLQTKDSAGTAVTPNKPFTAHSPSDTPLTIRLPKGTFNAVLLAGSKIPGKDEGLLLAADITTYYATAAAATITGSTALSFTLQALDLSAKNFTKPAPAALKRTANGYPYYSILFGGSTPGPALGDLATALEFSYAIKINTATVPAIIKTGIAIDTANIDVRAVSAPDTANGISGTGDITLTAPTYAPTTALLGFKIAKSIPAAVAPAAQKTGLAKLVFDIPVKAAFGTTPAAVEKALTWHIQNGVNKTFEQWDMPGSPTNSTGDPVLNDWSSGGGILLSVGVDLDMVNVTITY
jgi:hypothetical protein